MDKIITFVAIQSFYEKENNFHKVLAYFILQCWKDKEPLTLSLAEIKKHLNNYFNIDAPLLVIETALKVLQNEKKVLYVDREYKLTDEGERECLDIKYKISSVERETSDLIHSLYNFSLQYVLMPRPSETDLEKALISFVRKNIVDTINILYSDNLPSETVSEKNMLDSIIISFLQQIKKADFDTLSRLVNGAILKEAIQKENFSSNSMMFDNCDLYLDTNVLLGLFNFDLRLFNNQVSELISLASKECKFRLKIFDFTQRETFAILNKYREVYPQIVAGAPVQNLFFKMKGEGWKIQEVEAFIQTFGEKTNSLGIEIVNTSDWNIDVTEDQMSNILRYKEDDALNVRKHDVRAVNAIQYLRKCPKYSLKDIKALFLTSDYRLFRYAKELLSVREYPLVLTNSIFANILWYTLPSFRNSNLPLSNIIAGNESKLLVREDIFQEFVRILRKRGLNENEISQIIVSNETRLLLNDTSLSEMNDEKNNFNTKMEKTIEKIREKEILDRQKGEELNQHLVNQNEEILSLRKSIADQECQLMNMEKKNQEVESDFGDLKREYNKRVKQQFNNWYHDLLSIIFFIILGFLAILWYFSIISKTCVISVLCILFIIYVCLRKGWELPPCITHYLPKTGIRFKESLFNIYKKREDVKVSFEEIE